MKKAKPMIETYDITDEKTEEIKAVKELAKLDIKPIEEKKQEKKAEDTKELKEYEKSNDFSKQGKPERKLTFLEKMAVKNLIRIIRKQIAQVKEKKVKLKEDKWKKQVRDLTEKLIRENDIEVTNSNGEILTMVDLDKLTTQEQIEIQEQILEGLEELTGITHEKGK